MKYELKVWRDEDYFENFISMGFKREFWLEHGNAHRMRRRSVFSIIVNLIIEYDNDL